MASSARATVADAVDPPTVEAALRRGIASPVEAERSATPSEGIELSEGRKLRNSCMGETPLTPKQRRERRRASLLAADGSNRNLLSTKSRPESMRKPDGRRKKSVFGLDEPLARV